MRLATKKSKNDTKNKQKSVGTKIDLEREIKIEN
jgi:hypothetical protein